MARGASTTTTGAFSIRRGAGGGGGGCHLQIANRCSSGMRLKHRDPFAFESVRAKQTLCGAKFRFEPAATVTTSAKASRQRQLAEGRILSTWRHTKFPDRSRLVHAAASRRPALSSGEANGWFLAKDLRS
jgi:hypothetical protein